MINDETRLALFDGSLARARQRLIALGAKRYHAICMGMSWGNQPCDLREALQIENEWAELLAMVRGYESKVSADHIPSDTTTPPPAGAIQIGPTDI